MYVYLRIFLASGTHFIDFPLFGNYSRYHGTSIYSYLPHNDRLTLASITDSAVQTLSTTTMILGHSIPIRALGLN